MAHYRNAQFTSFAENLDHLIDDDGEPIYPINFLAYGIEICPETQRRHLQGYVEFSKKMYMKGIKALFDDNGLHIEKVIDLDALMKYNKKDGDYHEFGKPKARSDYIKFKEDWDKLHNSSVYDLICNREDNDFSDIRALLMAKEVISNGKLDVKEREFKEFYGNMELTPIQLEILEALDNQNDRQVLWIYDKVGNNGKTWLANHLLATRDTCILGNGRSRDLAHIYNGQDIVVFDFTRTVEGRINYQIIEEMKNGRILAPKYNSRIKYCLGVKILILANFLPDYNSMSLDRWDVRSIESTDSGVILDPL